MTILLTMREDISGFKGEKLESLSKNWIFLLKDLKADFLLCPNLLSISKKYIQKYNISKIILTGGGDVYDNHEENEANRQTVENYLIETSIVNSIPLFGICRGMQVINKYFGGEKKCIQGHAGTTHKISFLNREKKFTVNSYHNEGISIDGLGKGLVVTALSEDKLVEAFNHKQYLIFAQMWHPERKILNVDTNKVFLDFLTDGQKNNLCEE